LYQLSTSGAVVDRTGSLSIEETTPMVTLAWDATDSVMTYATYSEGFRDGGFPARFVGAIPQPLPFYDPEYVTNYELGVKSTLLDGRMRLNAAAFLMDYEDQQVTATAPFGIIGASTTKDNLGDSTIWGLEVELTAAVADALLVNASYAHMQDEIDSVVGGVLVSGSFQITTSNHLPYVPRYTGSLGGQYTFELGDAGQVILRADYAKRAAYYTQGRERPRDA
jgi:iron complex outermembrane receptor protein